MGSYASLAVRDSSGTIIGYQSTSTGQIAYEPGFSAGGGSAAYQSLVAAYGQQHYSVVGSSGTIQQPQYSVTPTYYDTSTAAGIAAMVGPSGALDIGVARLAIAEGYSPNLISVASATSSTVSGYAIPLTSVKSVSEIRTGIDVAPTFDKAVMAQGPALAIPASAMTGGTVTTYVPYGNYAQTELLGTKDIINPISGEIAIYQLSKGGYYYKLIGGGGIGALQSGQFTIQQPETSLVYTQVSAGKALAAATNATEAANILSNTSGYSRLGSEVYGGFVVPLTGKTVTETGAQLSTYATQYNLANLVSPTGINLSKANMGLVSFPWTISSGTSAISTTTGKAITGYGSATWVMPTQVGATEPSTVAKSDLGTIGGLKIIPGTAQIISGGTGIAAVPGSYKFESTAVGSSPTLQNFFANLGQNLLAEVGGASPGTYGFGSTTVKESYDVSIPTPYVSSAPSGYSPSRITYTLSSETTKYESSLYETIQTGIASKIPAVPIESQISIARDQSLAGKATGFSVGIYTELQERPLDVVKIASETYLMGMAFGGAEYLGKSIVAKSAASELPLIGTVGRLASTPIAADVLTIGKYTVGGIIVAESAANIISQPTSVSMGEAFTKTAVGFAGFGVGYTSISFPEPVNIYAGKGFSSGVLEISPLTKAGFTIESSARSLFTSQPSAYREVATIVLPGRTIAPEVLAEPNLGRLSVSGPYATEIKSTLLEQPSVIKGSSTFLGQYKPEISETAGIRTGKDVDVLVRSSTTAIESLSSKLGKTPEEVKELGIIDPHQFPKGYPGQESIEEISPSVSEDIRSASDAMYIRYRMAFPLGSSEIISPGTKGYTGQLSYEAIQLGFGEKASAVAAVIENPIAKGYRAPKDIYDFITLYSAQKASAISQGIPESRFKASDIAMQSFMKREFTFGTVKGQKFAEAAPTVTMRVQDIYEGFLSRTKPITVPAELNIVAIESPPSPLSRYSIIGLPEVVSLQPSAGREKSERVTSEGIFSGISGSLESMAESVSLSQESLIPSGLLNLRPPVYGSSGFQSAIPSGVSVLASPLASEKTYTPAFGSISNLVSPSGGITSLISASVYQPSISTIIPFPTSVPTISPPSVTPSPSYTPYPSYTPSPPEYTPPSYVPPPPIPKSPLFPDTTGWGGVGFGMKRRRHFMEIFRMGLDISSRGGMKLPKGVTMPKGLKLPKALTRVPKKSRRTR
ncbi:MAG: hypothetical protein PHX61_02235 [Alphaproteobacteria bacterium]|nr:hypothetical protein [Alphaproteobacteria bacterium]